MPAAIAITGVGCVSALGLNFREFSDRLLAGDSGIGPITRCDTSTCKIKAAAEVQGWEPANYFGKEQASRLDRFAQFAVVASREAVAGAGLTFSDGLAERTAIIHGTGVGGHTSLDDSYHRLYAQKASRLHPLTVPRLMFSSGVSHISIDLGIKGPTFAIASACASAGHAMAMAAMMIRSGAADVVLTGGAEACITLGTMKGWEELRVMTPDACRPFSKDRTGMLLGEGAATLVFESLDHAKARGARILAVLTGVGMCSDAHHLVMPHVDGAERAIRGALADAGLEPAAVDYINAHGTGTEQNDLTEAAAIHRVFRERAREIPVSSSKAQFGHLLGGAAAMEAAAVLAALERQVAPPTLNYLGLDPECDLDCVPNEPRPQRIDVAMSNSFAFGGLNASLVFQSHA